MAWIELHQSLVTHKKTRRLARALGLGVPDGIPQAIGHLCIFWLWCVDSTEDGSLADLDAQDIADAAGWTGDPEKFMEAMVAAEFIDKTEDGLHIHDWYNYIGSLIEQKKESHEKTLARKQRYRDKKRKETEKSGLKPEDLPTMDDDRFVDDDWLKVVTAYEDNLGRAPIGTACEMLQSYVDDLSADVVVSAIKETNKAQPGNPWVYLKKILDTLAALHIDTEQKFEAYMKDWEREKATDNRQNAPEASEPSTIQKVWY